MQSLNPKTRTWAMLCHLASFLGLILSLIGLPPFAFTNIVGPLIVWLIKKNEHEFIDAHGRESLNFQISMTLYGIALTVLFFIILFVLILAGAIAANDGGIGALIFGVFGIIWLVILGVIVGLLQLVLVIFAAVKANKGEFYRYPLTIRFL
ncbi:MAG: DUF4870 domain-containing protein [Oscillatoria sp. PMC 1051.18]|nr:DUF4870 domain-containing protein [Oscillatoria sp. PMC 1050.18]MEC5030584.1 DUF4870 domain-containing protein [Oscillatoria sp. PMC 1051.18]